MRESVWWYFERLPEPWPSDGEHPPDTRFLSVPECRHYAGLRSAKRRGDWLRGRYVAKKAVRHLMSAESAAAPALERIEILPSPSGAPALRVDGSEIDPLLSLSLSHSGDAVAVAVSTWRGAAVGIDCERIEPRSEAFIADYLTTRERRFVQESAWEAGLSATLIWSGKEALLKTIGVGLSVDARTVWCIPQGDPASSGWQILQAGWTARDEAARLGPVHAWWRTMDGFVVCCALVEAAGVAPESTPVRSIASPAWVATAGGIAL